MSGRDVRPVAEEAREPVLRALVECGFLFSARDFTPDRKREDAEATVRLTAKAEAWVRAAGRRAIPVIESTLQVSLPRVKLSPVANPEFDFDAAGMQESLTAVRRYTDLVAFRYAYSQPVVAAVVFADELEGDRREAVFRKFDEAVLDFRRFSSTVRAGLGKVRLSVTGIILWCFERSEYAREFEDREKDRLRAMHFWKKANALSWSVDLQDGRLTKHKGLPWILDSVFDATRFRACLAAGPPPLVPPPLPPRLPDRSG